jgi:hypothetical protein
MKTYFDLCEDLNNFLGLMTIINLEKYTTQLILYLTSFLSVHERLKLLRFQICITRKSYLSHSRSEGEQ